MLVTGNGRDYAAKEVRRIFDKNDDIRTKCPNASYGHRPTPMGDIRTVVEVIMMLPGERAGLIRADAARLLSCFSKLGHPLPELWGLRSRTPPLKRFHGPQGWKTVTEGRQASMQFNVVWTYLWFSLGFSSFQTLCTSPVMFPPSLQSTGSSVVAPELKPPFLIKRAVPQCFYRRSHDRGV